MTEDERQYLDVLRQREEVLKRIAALQDEIEKGAKSVDPFGFGGAADSAKQNRLISERIALLQREKTLAVEIGKTNAGVVGGSQFHLTVADRFAQLKKQREDENERMRLASAVRRADLRDRYGPTAGGFMGRLEQARQSRLGGMLGGTATWGGAMAGGMAKQGFGGTVEQNRFDYEWKMLTREFAAVFKPIIELMTWGANKLRRWMETLGETGQNALLVGGIAAGAYGLRRAGGRAIGGLAGGLMGGPVGAIAGGMMGGGGGFFGGGGGGGGGSAAMNMAALGVTAVSATTGLPVTTAVARGGMWRAGLRAAVRFPIKHPVATAVVATTAAAGLAPSEDSDWFRKYHGDNAVDLDQLQATGGVDALKKRYDELRANRDGGLRFNKAISWVGARFGYAGQERDTIHELERRMTAQGMNFDNGRRSVTPEKASYDEIGSGYKRASLAYLNATSGEAADGGGVAKTNLLLEGIAASLGGVEGAMKKPEVK